MQWAASKPAGPPPAMTTLVFVLEGNVDADTLADCCTRVEKNATTLIKLNFHSDFTIFRSNTGYNVYDPVPS